jgi:hypothetical protein
MLAGEIIDIINSCKFIKKHSYLKIGNNEYISIFYEDNFKVRIDINNGHSTLNYIGTTITIKNDFLLNSILARLVDPTKRYNVYEL